MVATVFTANPALNANDANPSSSFRVICTLAADSNGSLQVTIQPGTVNDFWIQNASFGKWDGDTGNANTTTTPVELKFGGVSGFVLATTPQVSDLTAHPGFSLAAGDKVVVIYDTGVNGANGGSSQRFNNAATNCETWFNSGTSYASATVAGFTKLAAVNYAVALIETNDAGSTEALAGTATSVVNMEADLTFSGVAALAGRARSEAKFRLSAIGSVALAAASAIRSFGTSNLTQQSTTTSEPVLVSATSTAFNTTTSPKSVSGIAVQNGDVVVAHAMREQSTSDIVSVATSSGSTGTWTLLEDVPGFVEVDQASLRTWWTTATATGNITVAFSKGAGSTFFGGTVKVYRNSGGVGAAESVHNGVGSGLPSVSITTTRDHSVLDFACADWNAAAGTATFTSSAGTPVQDSNVLTSGRYRASSSHVNAGNAGSKTIGMSAPSGQRFVAAAIEIFGLGEVGSLVAKAGIVSSAKSIFSGAATGLTGAASATTKGTSVLSGRASLSGQAGIVAKAGTLSQVVILAMQTRFLPAMRGVLTTTVSLGASAGSVFRVTSTGDATARTGLAGLATSAIGLAAGIAGATGLTGLAKSASRAAATASGRVILEIQTRILPAMRGVLDAAVIPTGVALAATAAAVSRMRAAIVARTSLEGAANASSRATGGLSALTALAGRVASKATSAGSMALRSALSAASAVRAASSGSMVGVVSLFGRAATSVAAMVTLPGTVVELIARATSATKIVADMVSRTALTATTSTAATASAAAPLFTTALRGVVGIATAVRTGATAVTEIAVTARVRGMVNARAAFSGTADLAGQAVAAVKALIGEGFTPLLGRTAARVSARALLFVLRPVIPTPTFPRPGRLNRLRASLEKAFGEEFDINPMTAGVDVNGRVTPDISRDPLVDVIGIWQGPATSRAPIARGSMSDDKAHNWNVSFPSARFDAAAVATVRKGDRLTRQLDNSVWLVERVVPDGFGRTTLQLTSRKRENLN